MVEPDQPDIWTKHERPRQRSSLPCCHPAETRRKNDDVETCGVNTELEALELWSYHDASRGAKIQLDDEAVPPGQEGSSSGRYEHVGIRGGSGIFTPSFG